MSVDKLVDSTQLDSDLTSVANAIRTKGGTSATLAFPADFVSAILAIPAAVKRSYTGGVVSFRVAAPVFFDSFAVQINPVQDLNGYDNPWPGGGGKNLCNPDTLIVGYYNDHGVKSEVTDYRSSDLIPVSPSTAYYSSLVDNSGTRIASLVFTEWDESQNFIRQSTANPLTTGATTKYIRIRNFQAQKQYILDDNFKYQVEHGSAATAYAPYSNICPISGWTEAKVTRTGKNILPPGTSGTQQGATYTVNPDGTITVTGTATGSSKRILNSALLKGGTQYVLSGCPIGGGQGKFGLALYETGTNTILGTDFGSGVTYTPVSDEIIDVGIRYWYGQSPAGTWKPQLEIDSSPTTYEPFSGNTYTIDLNGTRYGGTLDVLTGVLTVDRANIASYNGETLPGEWISSMDVYAPGTTPTTGAQVVYELASSQTVQLTPQQVFSLLGANNVWADTNGDVALEYTEIGI